MSWSASISIIFSTPIINPLKSIMSLIEAGWRPYWEPGRAVLFLPLGDAGMYDWKDSDTWQQAAEEIGEKIKHGESIGVVLYYEDTDVQFLFNSEYTQVSAILNSANRRTLNNSNSATDFTWYLQRIIHPLTAEQGAFTNLTCCDMR